MRYLFFLIVCICANVLGNAQFKVAISYEEQQEQNRIRDKAIQDSLYQIKQIASYDSLVACPKQDAIYGLVGQRVMVKPYSEKGNKMNYIKFYTSPNILHVYEPRNLNYDYKNEYDYYFDYQSTKYSSVENRIFTITNIVNYDENEIQIIKSNIDSLKKLSESAFEDYRKAESVTLYDDWNTPEDVKQRHIAIKDSLGSVYHSIRNRCFVNVPELNMKASVVFIELTDEKDTIYYMFDKSTKYPVFPFNIEGYITKLTELKKKERYAKCISLGDTDTDFYTGKTIQFYIGQIWWLKEIIIDPKSGDLVELYTNSKGEVYKSSSLSFGADFKTKEESDRIKKKYGITAWKAIMSSEIYKGMSESALIESWGQPDYINDASYGEQWVYGNTYVYIRNGRVTAWN